MSSIDYSIIHEGQLKIHTIVWKVPNFYTFINESKTNREFRPTEIIDISNERNKESSDSKFKVKMQFGGRENLLTDILYLSPTRVVLKFVLSCYDGNYSPKLLKESQYHTVQANKWQHMFTFIKGNTIQLLEGTLVLNIKFFLMKVDQMNSPEVKLNNDFENILNNGMFYDVTMKSADGIEYKAHKEILAGRSAVLKAHFEHNTTECVTNIVESPLESEVLREVLTFIYSGRAPSVDEIPEKLIAAADYYQLSDLISLCGETLQKRLTVENAIETLQLADSHSVNALKQFTLEFISGLPAGLITKTEGWAKIKSIELLMEIFEYITADNMDTVK